MSMYTYLIYDINYIYFDCSYGSSACPVVPGYRPLSLCNGPGLYGGSKPQSQACVGDHGHWGSGLPSHHVI